MSEKHLDEEGIVPHVRLALGLKREVDGSKLESAWLTPLENVVKPLARLLDSLVKSGHLKPQELEDTLRDAYQPIKYGRLEETETAEVQVTRAAIDRLLALLALHLTGGDPKISARMLGRYNITSDDGDLGADLVTLGKFVNSKRS